MRAAAWGGAALALAISLVASSCSSDTVVQATTDGGDDAGFGLTSRDGSGEASNDASMRRVVPHQGVVLAHPHVRLVYIGDEGVDGAPNVDDFVSWLVTSSWWDLLVQYGVEKGTMLPSVRIPTNALFPPGSVEGGLIAQTALEQRIGGLLHPGLFDAGVLDASGVDSASPPPPPDAGDDAGLDGSTFDASDGGPLIPPAEVYVFMLPNGVNVSLGNQGSHVFQTCIDAGGYHGYDGFEPYAVMPPCRLGRSALAISHELAEVTTNPVPGAGWFSENDADQRAGGGEIADICNFPVSKGVDGWLVSQIWSNAAGACVPQ